MNEFFATLTALIAFVVGMFFILRFLEWSER